MRYINHEKDSSYFFFKADSIEINCIVILTFTTNLCFISGMNYSPKHTANGSSITEYTRTYSVSVTQWQHAVTLIVRVILYYGKKLLHIPALYHSRALL